MEGYLGQKILKIKYNHLSFKQVWLIQDNSIVK